MNDSKFDTVPKELVADYKYIVEANSYESLCIYEKYKCGAILNIGYPHHIGYVANSKDHPVVILLTKCMCNGMMYLQYEAISSSVDYALIDEWLMKHFPRVPKSDAMNFHNVEHASQL